MEERHTDKLDPSVVQPLFALYRNGEYEKLAACTEPLLKQHPGASVLHSLLGAAHLEMGDYPAAIAQFRNALAISPDLEKLHNSLGIAHLRMRQDEEAAACFSSAIDRNPRFAPAWFNLGLVEENRRHWPRAAECYRQAIGLNPDYAEAHDALATVLWQMGREEEAAGHYERALARRRDYLPAYRNYLNFLEKTNRHRELRECLARAETVLGEHPLVRLYRGVLADIEGDPAAAKTLLEAVPPEGEDSAALHTERERLARLVRICDRLGETAQALDYAAESNRLTAILYARQGIDKQTYLNKIADRQRCFTPGNLRAWPRGKTAPQDKPPVFVVGFPRSGTTLLDSILRGHPSLRVAEESDAVPAMIDRLASLSADPLGHLANASNEELEELRATCHERLAQRAQGGEPDSILIDRSALNIVHVGEVARIFPEAKFILVMRHPADCVLSCYMQAFYETPANASFCSLEDAAALYDAIFTLWRQVVENLEPEVHQVRYEAIIEDMESVTRAALDFIGVPWDESILDYQRTARARPVIRTASYNQVVQPLYSRAKGRWLRYRDAMQPVLPVLQPWIDYFGYSD